MLAILLFALSGERLLGDLPPERAMQIARETLARELNVSARGIRVRDVQRAEWPDASLGCPEKGVQYAQVVTAGYRMRLEVGEKSYPMHVAGERAIRCDAPPRGRTDLGPADALAIARAQRMAREDLARRLKIDLGGVRVRSVRRGSPGCADTAAASMGPAGPEKAGWVLDLEAKGRSYRYHADGQRVMFCDEPAG
jgi:hypothetical protein